MNRDNRPVAEQWYEAGLEWVDAEAAASLLEETKSAALADMIARHLAQNPGLPFNRAEAAVKSSDDWRAWVEGMVRARQRANRARINRDYLRMRFSQYIGDDANARVEARMTR